MKKIVFILSIAAIVISVSSCGNKKQKAVEKAGTHAHEDGTVHAGETHNQNNETTPEQESFEIKADNDSEHEHGDGDNHDSDAEHKHAEGDSEGHDHDHEHSEQK